MISVRSTLFLGCDIQIIICNPSFKQVLDQPINRTFSKRRAKISALVYFLLTHVLAVCRLRLGSTRHGRDGFRFKLSLVLDTLRS